MPIQTSHILQHIEFKENLRLRKTPSFQGVAMLIAMAIQSANRGAERFHRI